jgi:SAM-dependent methyltransferase
VACGRGAILFPAAERVGTNGKAVGIDFSAGMVQAAQQEAERRGLTVRVLQMDAEQLDFPDASFNRVLCGFGMMFLPNQQAALSEWRRVLAPDGRLAVSTWRASESADLMAVLGSMGVVQGPPPGWITEPDDLAARLSGAGFSDVQVRIDTATFHFADLEAYWQGGRATGYRATIDGMDEAQATQARAALAERLRHYQQEDGYHVPASALLGTASR